MQGLQILLISTCFALIESNSSTVDEGTGRVSNGEDYIASKFPYVVVYTVAKDTIPGSPQRFKVCTGSLVTPRFVLTTALCTNGTEESRYLVYIIRLYGKTALGVEKIIHQKEFQSFDKADLSVLRMNGTFSSVTEFPKLYGDIEELGEKGMTCTIIGFGINENKEIQNSGKMAEITLKSGEKGCGYGDTCLDWGHFLCSQPSKTMACDGDSGGPVICNGYLYGVSSHLVDISNDQGEHVACGTPDSLALYQYIKVHKEWLDNVIFDDKVEDNAGTIWHQKLYTVFIILNVCFNTKIIF